MALAAGRAVDPGRNPYLHPLFAKPNPDAANFARRFNPQSLRFSTMRDRASDCGSQLSDVMQFETQGYFVRDKDSTPARPVFNRTIGLRDTLQRKSVQG